MMVTFKGSLKVEVGDKWYMLTLVDMNEYVIEVRKWLGR